MLILHVSTRQSSVTHGQDIEPTGDCIGGYRISASLSFNHGTSAGLPVRLRAVLILGAHKRWSILAYAWGRGGKRRCSAKLQIAHKDLLTE